MILINVATWSFITMFRGQNRFPVYDHLDIGAHRLGTVEEEESQTPEMCAGQRWEAATVFFDAEAGVGH